MKSICNSARSLALLAGLLFAANSLYAQVQSTTITVQLDKTGSAISPTLYGVFFEDINFAADGGIYPELVKNRSFEFIEPLMGWKKIELGGAVGTWAIADQQSLNGSNPHYLRLVVESTGEGFGVANEGFRGMGVVAKGKYLFSVYVRSADGQPGSLVVELVGQGGQKLGRAEVGGFGKEWKKYSAIVEASGTDAKAHLNVLAKGKGVLDLDMISLLPQETFNGHGLRPDLVQLLKDIKPGFVRFPGGCIVEGRDLNNRYQWKDTIGDVAQRRLILNRWNNEFKQKNAPDYFQSFGLGFYEYFQLCEDIGAKPLPILNCGMACQYNTKELAPLDQLGPYIQDVLDLIEFANGPADSIWGKKRAEMGHPTPFGLTMVGIGNEQWGPQYLERYERFATVLKAKHPQVRLISSAGPGPSGKDFDLAWNRLRQLQADVIDEHYYKDPAWFLANAGRYDKYDRNGPKVFAGEYAAHVGGKRNNWESALAEAAFMTGLERNGDLVQMSSYAPLFAHVDAWQWAPNLIWFDNLHSYGTPNYYVQKLFSANRGKTILPISLDGARDGLFVCASSGEGGEVVLKVVNTGATARPAQIKLSGERGPVAVSGGQLLVLVNSDRKAENTLDEPTRVAPVSKVLTGANGQLQHEFPPYSVSVVRVSAEMR